jgi:hypothetical protein
MALSRLSLLPMLLLPRLRTSLTKFSFRGSRTVLLWFYVVVMLRFFSRLVFLAFLPPPPLLLFALNLPCRLAAVADALLGMVNSNLLLLLLQLIKVTWVCASQAPHTAVHNLGCPSHKDDICHSHIQNFAQCPREWLNFVHNWQRTLKASISEEGPCAIGRPDHEYSHLNRSTSTTIPAITNKGRYF